MSSRVAGDVLRKGRLRVPPEDVMKYTSSIEWDKYIAKAVIDINRAHMLMLVRTGVVSKSDGATILLALSELDPRMRLDPRLEDVHMNVEARVIEKLGEEVGGKLHTAKSRNDQVSAALRMVLRDFVLDILECLLRLQAALLEQSKKNLETIMPGYSHLQHAQPITLASYLLAHHDSLERGCRRLMEAYSRINLSPMGATALATTSFPIDRDFVAEFLGFEGLVESSLDAVSSRDFAIEAISDFSLIMNSLSKMAEELVLWSTREFGIAKIPDEYISTSSIMPQKRNPVVPELIRAKSSHVYGNLATALSITHGLPLGYSLDLQELNRCIWDSCEITLSSVNMMRGIMEGIEFDRKRLRDLASRDFSTATDLADLLVKELGIPFRTAHHTVGVLVGELLRSGKALEDLKVEELNEVLSKITGLRIRVDQEELSQALSPERSVKARKVKGGPAPRVVLGMIESREDRLKEYYSWLKEKRNRLKEAKLRLDRSVNEAIKTAEARMKSPARRKLSQHPL